MNNATSKFGAWDHSFSISQWRNNISAAGEGREMGRMIVRSDPLGNESKIAAK